MKKTFKSLNLVIVTLSVFVALALTSCSSGSLPTPDDTSHLQSFHEKYFSEGENLLNEKDLALYVDYSTCITLGQHSTFFQKLQSPLVVATKHYYSIKGPTIQEEKDINVYHALRNIVEVNYADLKKAANLIADGNSEAVLLTDGEFYQKNIADGGINDPYMAEPLTKWLKKGHDVHVFVEPYVEKHKGIPYNKQRFYFIFTDNRMPGNIYERICATADLHEFLPEVKYFHLSAHHPTVTLKNNRLETNETLSAKVKSYGNYEIQDWEIDWDAIGNVMFNSVDMYTGEPAPYGTCAVGGLKVDKDSYGGFRISEIEVKAYDINSYYTGYYYYQDAAATGSTEGMVLPQVDELYPSENAFVYDEEAWNSEGIVNIHFNTKMWNPDFLSGKPFNYTKIDVCVAKCDNVFAESASIFDFDAIGYPGQKNVSVSQSIKQALFDPDIQKMMNSSVLYTVYVKSNKY